MNDLVRKVKQMINIDRKTLYILCALVFIYGIISVYLVMHGLGFLAVLGLFLFFYQYITVVARRIERSEDLNAYERYYRNSPNDDEEYNGEFFEKRRRRNRRRRPRDRQVSEESKVQDKKEKKTEVVKKQRTSDNRQKQSKKQRNPLNDKGF